MKRTVNRQKRFSVTLSMFLRDKVRPYRTDNLYAVIQREIKEKEELQIDRQQQKGGKD